MHRLEVALAPRRRRGAAVRAEVHLPGAPRIEGLGREVAHEREALGHHLAGVLPAADWALRSRNSAGVMTPFVSARGRTARRRCPTARGRTGLVRAVDVHEVGPVGPLDPLGALGELVEVVDVGERRVQHERREPEPGRPALGEGRRRRRRVAVHHLVAEEPVDGVERFHCSISPAERFFGKLVALSPSTAWRTSGSFHFVVAVGDVEVVLEQLAVADVDRLRDHVRVGVLRDRGVEQAWMVLPVDVLLDRPAGAADADGVGGTPWSSMKCSFSIRAVSPPSWRL